MNGDEELVEKVRSAVQSDRFFVSRHAAARLRERHVMLWQIVGGIEEAHVVRERPDNEPDPVVELQQSLPDQTDVLVVWAWVQSIERAKLVTVHFL